MAETGHIIVATFYKFVSLENYRELRQPLLKLCHENEIRGTILLAAEGINATVAGAHKQLDRLISYLGEDPRFNDMEYKESPNPERPFYRMKVKLRREIVTLGVPGINPGELSGIRVPPEKWNELISDPEVVVIDVRNQYESTIGSFKDAVQPGTGSFREFPAYVAQHFDPQKHKKVAMYCTGGIRCEKASAYMRSRGFENVYQLQGGILRYLQQTRPEQSLWEGECFVFDGRVAVNPGLNKGEYEQCYSCRYPLSAADRNSPKYEEGVSCPKCVDSLTDERRLRLRERQRQVGLAAQRNQQHIGVQQGCDGSPHNS